MALAPRRIDHRWDRATEATQLSQSQALYQLRDADPIVRDAYAFKVRADAGLDTSRWPAMQAALELQTQREKERLFVEGLLLTGAPNDTIAQHLGCAPEDVQAFHDLFFDVRPHLKHAGWLVGQLFGGSLYQTINPRDKVGQLHRIAWMGGESVFLSYYTGKRVKADAAVVAELIQDMIRKQSLLASMCLVGRDEVNIDLVRVFIESTTEDVVNEAAGHDKALADAIFSFTKAIPLTVADPTDERNLKRAARELRAHEYLVSTAKPTDEPHV
jgi:hypothetical protein